MLRALNDNVVIEIVELEKKTASGIILSKETSKPSHSEGVIVAVGEGKCLENGTLKTPSVSVGQRVIYNGFAGTKVSHQGKDLVILSSDDVLAVVE